MTVKRFFGHTRVATHDTEVATTDVSFAPSFAREDVHHGMMTTGSWNVVNANYVFFPQELSQFAPLEQSHLNANRIIVAVHVDRTASKDLVVARQQLRDALRLLEEYRRVLPALPEGPIRLDAGALERVVAVAHSAASSAFLREAIVGVRAIVGSKTAPDRIEVRVRPSVDTSETAQRTRRLYSEFERLAGPEGLNGVDVSVEYETQ